MNNKTLYDFEGFRVDVDQRCLWRGEDLVSLTPKAFETLLVLVKNKGKVVSKNSLLDEVWANTFVEEATLAQNISTLRKTFASFENGKDFIVTIPRRGYRFVADVAEVQADEEVLVVEKRSVTHIVAEQEVIHISDELAAVSQDQKSSHKENIFRNRMFIALPLLVLATVIAGAFIVYNFARPESSYSSKFNNFRVNNLFSGRNIGTVAASPDGKYIAVLERRPEGDSILLKQPEGGNSIEVLPNSSLNIIGITFAPNSDYIFYTAYKKQGNLNKIGSLYKIPILGGASQTISKDVDSNVTISSDNKRITFVRNNLKGKKSDTYSHNEGTTERD